MHVQAEEQDGSFGGRRRSGRKVGDGHGNRRFGGGAGGLIFAARQVLVGAVCMSSWCWLSIHSLSGA